MEEFTWELVLGEQEGLERKELKAQEGLRVEKSQAGLSSQQAEVPGVWDGPFSLLSHFCCHP